MTTLGKVKFGIMEFDSADVNALVATGLWEATVLHEMVSSLSARSTVLTVLITGSYSGHSEFRMNKVYLLLTDVGQIGNNVA